MRSNMLPNCPSIRSIGISFRDQNFIQDSEDNLEGSFMESHLSSFSPFQNINITAKNEMLSHEVDNHKPTEKC